MGTLVWPARLMPRILRCGISAQWERTHTEVRNAIFPRRAKCTSWLPTLVHLVTSSSCLCPTTTWQRCVCPATQCQVPPWKVAHLSDRYFHFVHQSGPLGLETLLKTWRKPLPGSEAMSLLKGMLDANPARRPTVQECLAHDWFAQER